MEDQQQLTWRKSSYSGGNGGGCVEIAEPSSQVLVRDSQLGEASPVLAFDRASWREFVASVRR